MREILFRGKAINRDNGSHRTSYKNGDWVYGLITREFDERFERLPAEMTDINGVSSIEVDYKTVGQYTGLTDKNGTKIFEGDLIRNDFGNEVGTIKFGEYRNPFNGGELAKHIGFYVEWLPADCKSFLRKDFGYWLDAMKAEIIGNIHDSPELLHNGEKL